MGAKPEGSDAKAWRAPDEAPRCGAGTGAAAWLNFPWTAVSWRPRGSGKWMSGWKPRYSGSLRSPREIAKSGSRAGQKKAVVTAGVQGPLSRRSQADKVPRKREKPGSG
jgi:hypothetical protein